MTTRPRCSATECKREALARGLCATHYQAARREEKRGGPAAPRSAPGEGAEVKFRCGAELKEWADKLAARLGVTPSEFGRTALQRHAERTDKQITAGKLMAMRRKAAR